MNRLTVWLIVVLIDNLLFYTNICLLWCEFDIEQCDLLLLLIVATQIISILTHV